VLAGVDSEIVDGTSAQLAQLAATPGVLGVEPNVSAHLESNSFGGRDVTDPNGSNGSGNGSGNGSNAGPGDGTGPTVTPPSTDSAATSAGPLSPVAVPSAGVIA